MVPSGRLAASQGASNRALRERLEKEAKLRGPAALFRRLTEVDPRPKTLSTVAIPAG